MLNKLSLIILLLLTSSFAAFAAPENILQFPTYEKSWEDSLFFYTRFTEKPDAVEAFLTKQCGFEKSTFTTPDGLKLECLIRKVINPDFTFNVAVGFIPGVMTGMATLTKMLPQNCNIIFYNNRGKGKSEGRMLPRLWDYGTHEYKDVIGACNYAKEINKDAPIVLYGTCAGTFANSKAICHLQETDKLKEYNIRAHIMDSTVVDLPTTIENIPQHFFDPKTWSGWFWTKFLWALRYTIFRPRFMPSGDAARLDPKALAQTNIPTLYYDCKKGDVLTPHNSTNNFYEEHLKNMSDKELCKQHTFECSSHANHLLKHKKEYAFALANFLNQHLCKTQMIQSQL